MLFATYKAKRVRVSQCGHCFKICTEVFTKQHISVIASGYILFARKFVPKLITVTHHNLWQTFNFYFDTFCVKKFG